jgi:hypothetical protein
VGIRQDVFERKRFIILKHTGLFILLWGGLLSPILTWSQEQDFGSWLNASVEYEAWKNVDLSLTPELRFDENLSRLRNVQADFGAQYKINKRYSTGAVLRIGQVQRNSGWQGRQRIQLFVGGKWKIVKDLDFSYKTRVQFAFDQQTRTRDADMNSNIRNKFGISYDGIKKTKLSASYEFFHGIQRGEFLEWQDWRLAFDVERKLNKRNFVSLGWIVQTEFTTPRVRRDNILVLSYKFVVPSKF